MSGLLRDLSRDAGIGGRVVLVAAHPDDEMMGLGSRLGSFRELTIVHLTDGAPRDLVDARREGFASALAYAAARRREFASALAAMQARPLAVCYGYPDQQAIRHCDEIVERLACDLAGARAVFTHPYEYGHPDHDAAALAVALACARLRARGAAAPERYEFASYHLWQGRPRFGAFWPDPQSPESELRLTGPQSRRKRAALACYATQQAVLAQVPVAPERVRPAPAYDFRLPAPPGEALYDRWGLAMTSGAWRRRADRALGGGVRRAA